MGLIAIITCSNLLGNIQEHFTTITVHNSSVRKVSFDLRLATVIKEG
jgi:hypothetical protein